MTSMLVLLFLYAGFIALTSGDANGAGGQRQGGSLSRGAAIYALVGAINIPIINRSVVWWNSLHQGPSITLGGSSIDNALLWPLGLTVLRSEEHTSELQSPMRNSYAVFCLKKKKKTTID